MTLVERLLAAAAQGPAGLDAVLGQAGPALPPDLREQAHSAFLQALGVGQGGAARAAANVALYLAVRSGDLYHGLESMIDLDHLSFLGADTVGQYAVVRDDCRDRRAKADQIGAGDLAFRAAVGGADCAYFACLAPAEGGAGGGKPWLVLCLEDLTAVPPHLNAPEIAVSFDRLVSLITGAAQEAMETVWTQESDAVDGLLAGVAALAESIVPADFEFGAGRGDAILTARVLAVLSGRHGSPANADARLMWLAERAAADDDVGVLLDTLSQRYALGRAKGAPPEGMAKLRASLLGLADPLRARYHSRAGRLWAGRLLESALGEMLQDTLSRQAMAPDALRDAIDAAKARTLWDRMGRVLRPLPAEGQAAQAEALERRILAFAPEDPTQETLVRSEMRLASQLSIGSEWDAAERRASVEELEALYAGGDCGFQGIRESVTTDAIRAALEPGEAVIEYFLPFHRTHPAVALWITVTTAQETRVVHSPLDGLPTGGMIGGLIIDGRQPLAVSPLGGLVTDTRLAIQRGQDDQARAGLDTLASLLIAPVVALGIDPKDFRRWIIVPHGVLHYVPFGALSRPEGRCLIQDVALTVVPSASVWHALQGHAAQPPTSFLGLAAPVLADTTLPPLPQTAKELQAVQKLLAGLECEARTGADATEAALRALSPGRSLVHVATHGEFPESDAIDFHRILLSADAGDDGRVLVEEVRDWDLRTVGLFVLSICNGGLYRFGPGDEPYGLIEGLLNAGVSNILATLWPLEDAVGSLFMRGFYKHVLADGPSEALRRACCQFITDGALLRHWAVFTLVGPGRPWPPIA